jgi:hypothetical protein
MYHLKIKHTNILFVPTCDVVYIYRFIYEGFIIILIKAALTSISQKYNKINTEQIYA